MPRSGKDTTALIEAVRNRHFLMADILLESGNRIDSTGPGGDNVLHVLCLSAGLIADDIRRTERRIADFSERWYSEKSKQETVDELENLREADRQCCHTARLILENGQIDPEEKNDSGKMPFDIASENGARKSEHCCRGKIPRRTSLPLLPEGWTSFRHCGTRTKRHGMPCYVPV